MIHSFENNGVKVWKLELHFTKFYTLEIYWTKWNTKYVYKHNHSYKVIL
jgi:hypothetical protein